MVHVFRRNSNCTAHKTNPQGKKKPFFTSFDILRAGRVITQRKFSNLLHSFVCQSTQTWRPRLHSYINFLVLQHWASAQYQQTCLRSFWFGECWLEYNWTWGRHYWFFVNSLRCQLAETQRCDSRIEISALARQMESYYRKTDYDRRECM